eukprot:scaffold8936_cov61-Phaeocystis_antarctica.AAC.17
MHPCSSALTVPTSGGRPCVCPRRAARKAACMSPEWAHARTRALSIAEEGLMPEASAASQTTEARDGRPAHARSSCTYGAAEPLGQLERPLRLVGHVARVEHGGERRVLLAGGVARLLVVRALLLPLVLRPPLGLLLPPLGQREAQLAHVLEAARRRLDVTRGRVRRAQRVEQRPRGHDVGEQRRLVQLLRARRVAPHRAGADQRRDHVGVARHPDGLGLPPRLLEDLEGLVELARAAEGADDGVDGGEVRRDPSLQGLPVHGRGGGWHGGRAAREEQRVQAGAPPPRERALSGRRAAELRADEVGQQVERRPGHRLGARARIEEPRQCVQYVVGVRGVVPVEGTPSRARPLELVLQQPRACAACTCACA